MRRRLAILLVALLAVAATQCSEYRKREALRNCKFHLTGLELAEANLDHVSLRLHIAVENPGPYEAQVDRIELNLYLRDRRAAFVETQESLRAPPGQTRQLNLQLTIALSELGQTLFYALLNGQELQVRVAGAAHVETFFGDLAAPIDISDLLKLGAAL
ncbi:MAG: LEA type 2 family protein [Leptospirales bacterium]|nr:LEA type 2 family protein [Leptospirales bacterium]